MNNRAASHQNMTVCVITESWTVLKTRQIHSSAIRKVKLKEHGLLKPDKELREPQRNGRLSSRICVQRKDVCDTREAQEGSKTYDRVCTRTRQVLSEHLSSKSTL